MLELVVCMLLIFCACCRVAPTTRMRRGGATVGVGAGAAGGAVGAAAGVGAGAAGGAVGAAAGVGAGAAGGAVGAAAGVGADAVSDGARLYERCIVLEHPLVKGLGLKIYDQAGDPFSPLYITDNVDWLHMGWRIKCQFVGGGKTLDFGGCLITAGPLRVRSGYFGFTAKDLDPREKQDINGMLKVRLL
jgi:hypothetical protein